MADLYSPRKCPKCGRFLKRRHRYCDDLCHPRESDEVEALAEALYAKYYEVLGGVNRHGEPMPDWAEESKSKHANGWILRARVELEAPDA